MDSHIFADPDPGSQNLADPTDPVRILSTVFNLPPFCWILLLIPCIRIWIKLIEKERTEERKLNQAKRRKERRVRRRRSIEVNRKMNRIPVPTLITLIRYFLYSVKIENTNISVT